MALSASFNNNDQSDPIPSNSPIPATNMLPLLARLAVGSAQAFDSVDAWTERLGDVPYAAEFIAQLRREWLPAVPPDAFCAQVRTACQARVAEWHTGWPNLWSHIERVTGYAMYLAPEADIPADQAFLLGVLHDVGKLDEMRTGELHEEIGAHFARQQLIPHYSRAVANTIAAAIGKQNLSHTPLARLLYDADKLDKIGATGIIRRVSQSIDAANAPAALKRIENDVLNFPTLEHTGAKALVALKEGFSMAFIQAVTTSG